MSAKEAGAGEDNRQLLAELATWEQGRIEVWGFWRRQFLVGRSLPEGSWVPPAWEAKQVCSLDAELLAPGQRFKRVDLDWYWGWLPGGEVGKTGVDKWSICGGQDARSGWVEVGLPRAWNGDIGSLLSAEEEDLAVALISKAFNLPGFDDYEEFEYVAACKGASPPDWPKLSQGVSGERKVAEMRLLGVLRMEQADMDSELRLALAWGTKSGAFLGWELLKSMAEVHQLQNDQARQFGPLPSWNEVENGLRLDTLGRDL